MKQRNKINIYGTRAFTSKFMPLVGQKNAFRYDYDRFMIVRIEEMFPYVDHHVPPTKSLNDVILVISDGQAHMNIGTESVIGVKNSILYVPSGQIFSFEKYEKDKFTNGFLITFTKDIFSADPSQGDIPELSLPHFSANSITCLDEQSFGFVLQLLERILKENNENGLTRLAIIRSYFATFLFEIRNKPTCGHNNPDISASLKLVKDFIELVSVHITSKKQVSDYASMLNISPNHLGKMVKKFTNKSPIRWIDETLILEAKVLLFQSDMSIAEISTSLGVFDTSYFSRVFKKYEGMPPLSFRNKTREISKK